MKLKTINNINATVLISLTAISTIAWSFFSCGPKDKSIQNVVLISIDTCRADYLSCYGFSRQTTPNIDQFAKEGTLFSNCYTPVPLTLPAHSSMLTGTIPPHHGIHDNLDYKLGSSNVTLAEILKEKDLSTVAVISAFVLDSRFGLNQGFDDYYDRFENPLKILELSERRGEETTRFAKKCLDKYKDERFFLFLHYYDPHTEYDPPEPYASKFRGNPYAGEIAYTDFCIGQVFQKLKDMGLYESSLIIVVGDHGEMLGEHGEPDHMYYIYQSAIKVPLIFKLPGQRKGMKVHDPVGIIDIVPTVCTILGLASPKNIEGQDLSDYFKRTPPAKSDRSLYAESMVPTKYGASSLLGLVGKRWKYIQTSKPELYDIVKDPDEITNLIEQDPQRARILKDQLKQILETSVRKDTAESRATLSEDEKNRLESLGYLSGTNVTEDFEFYQSKDDPKDIINFHKMNGKVVYFMNQGKLDEAKSLCEKMLQQRPQDIETHRRLAGISWEQQDYEKTVQYLSVIAKNNPEDFKVHNKIGKALLKLDKIEKAIQQFQEAKKLRPQNFEPYCNLGSALIQKGEYDEAIKYLKRALEIYPESSEAKDKLAVALNQKGEVDVAIDRYEKALQENPSDPALLNNLAWMLATHSDSRFRDPDKALTLALRACELTNYDEPHIMNSLATAYAAQGNYGKAIEIAEKTLVLVKSKGQTGLITKAQESLDMFRAGIPYHEFVPSSAEKRK